LLQIRKVSDSFAPHWNPTDFEEPKTEETRLLAMLKVPPAGRAIRVKDLAYFVVIEDRNLRKILEHLFKQ
jgi:hypothetical protein